MLSLLTPSTLKIALLGLIIGALTVFGAHYMALRHERDGLQAQVGAMNVANEVQKATIEGMEAALSEWRANAENFQAALREAADNSREAQEYAQDLERKLARHNMAALARAKPGLVEGVINSATACIGRMLEYETGGGGDDPGCDIPTRR